MGNRIVGTTGQIGSNRLLVDYAGNGDTTSLQAALDAAAVYASASNRWLVQVAPGTYEGRLALKNYVDIAGLAPGAGVVIKALSGSLFSTPASCRISCCLLRTVDGTVVEAGSSFSGELVLDNVLIDQTPLDVSSLSVAGGTVKVCRSHLAAGGAAVISGGTLEIHHSTIRNQALSDGGSNAALSASGGTLIVYGSVIENTGAAGYGIYISGTSAVLKLYHSLVRKKSSSYAVHSASANSNGLMVACGGNAALHSNWTGFLDYVYDAAA